MEQYNYRLRKIAKESDVSFIDLEQFVPKSLIYFIDEVHYTDSTFNNIGQILAEEIIRLNILK
ncbi:MAG: hypothetical protein JXB49_25495 [Bacteroidales bacterium]|nr:hypothetical protein [Bacteroidales bacterium]